MRRRSLSPVAGPIAAGLALALASAPIVVNAQTVPQVSISIDRDEAVGPRKAGLICLPNGRFEWPDFFESEDDLAAELILAIQASGEKRRAQIVTPEAIELAQMKIDLCARNFLPGESGKYSGRVQFLFVFRSVGEAEHPIEIDFKVSREESLTPNAITRRALRELVDRMVT